MTLDGIDVSAYQADIDWQKVGVTKRFAFIKATEHLSYVDPKFIRNWEESAKVADFYRGAYHFYRPRASASLQANHFIDTLIKAGVSSKDLPPVIDAEVWDDAPPLAVYEGICQWCDLVSSKLECKPIVYTSPSFWSRIDGIEKLTTSHLFADLWIAHWGVRLPSVPRHWDNWSFWQTSEKGTVDGIAGNVDLDVFNGSLDELLAYYVKGDIDEYLENVTKNLGDEIVDKNGKGKGDGQ